MSRQSHYMTYGVEVLAGAVDVVLAGAVVVVLAGAGAVVLHN